MKTLKPKFSSRLIAKILTLCGISLTCTACYSPGGDRYRVLYITEIDGTVISNETDDPIEGIIIRSKSSYFVIDGDGKHESYRYGEWKRSDQEGKYAVSHNAYPPKTITVIAQDLDGAENGGQFATQEKEIEIYESDFVLDVPEDDSSSEGTPATDPYETTFRAKKIVDFTLELETPEEPTDQPE